MKRSLFNWARLCAAAVCVFLALATLAGCSIGSEAENDEYDFSDWET